jgi:hypothetical protein
MNIDVPLLFQLPHAWFVAILSEWLDMPSIGKLDTAISSKAYRPQFLSSLQKMRSTTFDNFSVDWGCGCLGYGDDGTAYWWKWLSIRQIYVERARLEGDDVRSDLIIPSMRDVKIKSCKDEDLLYLVRNCPSLRCLSIDTSMTDAGHPLVTGIGLAALTNLRETLEEFSFCRFSGDGNPHIAAALVDVFRQCFRLYKVSLTGNALDSVDPADLIRSCDLPIAYGQPVSNFLTSCSNLKKFGYVESDDEQDALVMTALHQSCPLLEELELLSVSLNQQQKSSFFTLANRNCKHLHTLRLSCCRALSASAFQRIAEMEALRELKLHNCVGLSDAVLAVVATMKLVVLIIQDFQLSSDWTEASVQVFVGSTICQTLESFRLQIWFNTTPIDDVQVITAFAGAVPT